MIALAAGTPRPAPPRRRRHGRSSCAAVTGGTYGAAQRRPRLPAVSGSGRRRTHAGPVRRQLEPAADLRLHRRPRLPRQPGPRHRLVRASCRRTSTRATSPTLASASPTSRRTTSRRPTGTFIPQQTYDQVLYELGLVGAVLFVVLVCLAVRSTRSVAGRKPRPGEPWGEQAYVPRRWLAVTRRRARRRRALRRLADRGALLADARSRRAAAVRSRQPEVTAPSLSIVHAIARLNVGGAALHVLQLAAEQSRRGHDVVVVAGTLAAGEESMEYVADELGVAVLQLPVLQRELSLRADPAAILALRRIIRHRRPDVLHTHTAKAGATGRIAAMSAGGARPRAIVHTYHGHVLSGYFSRRWERIFRSIERALALMSGSADRRQRRGARRPRLVRRRAGRSASSSSRTASTSRRGARRTSRRGGRCAPRSAPVRRRSSSAGRAA